jgi:Ca-activated chloride channel family protein
MRLAWPFALLSLLLVPLLLGVYLWVLRRRRRQAVPYSSLTLIKAARPPKSAWRRHVPFALILAALACLGVAAARPELTAKVPVSSASVIVALDVSGSMCSTDVSPNRLSAAEAAVRQFARSQNPHTRIGLVAFSSFAQLVVQPTTDRGELTKSLDSLTTGRGTAIGAAILKSVDAIAAIDSAVAPAGTEGTESSDDSGDNGVPGPTPSATAAVPPKAASGGSYAPEIVVLLTDGANTQGIGPVQAAAVAAQRGVRVYPIGFGTNNPNELVCTVNQLGGSAFEGGGGGNGFRGGGSAFGSGSGPLVADNPTLRQVATTTGGTFFTASAADQLQKVLKDLPRHVQVQQRNIEVSFGLAALAAVLILFSVVAAVRWSTFPA